MNLSHQESVPLIFSLIAAGRDEMVVKQMMHMARLADAFGKELEIVVLADDELTGCAQILVIVVGEAEPLVQKTGIPADQVDGVIAKFEMAYPAARTVII